MMLAQMMPEFAWIPVIVLTLSAILIIVTGFGASRLVRRLPRKVLTWTVTPSVRYFLVALAVVLMFLLIAWTITEPRVDDALTYQIKPGMTRAEVKAILGAPHECESSSRGREVWGYYIREFGWTAWMNPVYVQFNAKGEVVRTWYH